jgi:quinol monooxygenase YgiN
MITALFEAWPKPEHLDAFLEFEQEIHALMAARDGFISAERFESLKEPGKFLSLAVFRDRAALDAWRAVIERYVHDSEFGHMRLLADYRLRIAEVAHDFTIADLKQVPHRKAAAG